MNLFYVHPDDIHLPRLILRDQEARHASKVLRYREGDELFATDGVGNCFRTEITQIDRSSITLTVLETSYEESENPRLTLCVGLIKKRDRLEFAAEKATELGVNDIIFFKGGHSQKENIRLDRLKATVLSAMKQSLRYYLPEVSVVHSLREVLDKKKDQAALIMADETTENNNRLDLQEKGEMLLIVGPEGGFSEEEREELKKRGAHPYSLGSKRLRTETAAIVITEHFRNNKQIFS